MPKTVWNRFFIGMALITSVALLIWIAGAKVIAQNTTSGDWTASVSSKDNKLQLNLERRSGKSGRHQMGQSYEFSEFQGLTREQALSGGPVSFSIVREAGRIDLEGSFQNGKGSGTFRFTGNPGFVSAMKSRGFDFESNADDEDRDSESRLFAATTLNVTTALADIFVTLWREASRRSICGEKVFVWKTRVSFSALACGVSVNPDAFQTLM